MDGPNVMITGAGRGIGRAIALRFARERASIALAARSSRELERVAAEVRAGGGRARAVPMDVADPASVDDGVRSALEFLGGTLDVLVNNAGVFLPAPFEEVSPEVWRRTLAVNLDGPYFTTRRALPGLARSARAHLFNVSSRAGLEPYPGSSAYCASKYGLRGLSDVLRLELEPRGIRVSTVYPGATDTTIFDGLPGTWDRSTMNRPEDVAEVVWRAYASPREAAVADLEVPPPVRREA